MPVLPTLTYSGKTKTGNEVTIFANLGVGLLKTQLGFGVSVPVVPCVAGEVCPAGSFDATVIRIPNEAAVGSIPAKSAVFTAAEGVHNPTVAGDVADVICLPNPADDFLICYDQGIQVTVGATFRAIARKFNPVDHVVPQRGDYSLTINDLYVSNQDGLQRVRGRRCTLIVKVAPAGGGSLQEIQYYTNVTLTAPPMNTGEDGNASITIQGTGNFSFCAIFSAAKV